MRPRFKRFWLTLCVIPLFFTVASAASPFSLQAQSTEQPSTDQGALTSPAQLASPIENPFWWWSLLHSNDDGDWDIYLARRDDQSFPQLIRLTNNTATDRNAQFDYGAQRIVFESDRDSTNLGDPNTEIYVMNADGSNQQRLTVNPNRDEMPDWSPTGDRIVFSAEHDDGMEIYVMRADGSARQRLTVLAGNDWFPAWSPDGQTIAWMRQGVNTGELWLMDANGANQRRLTEALPWLGRPRWSRDGRYLAFSYRSRADEGNHIGIVNRDGANLHELRCTSPLQGESRSMAAWTPDGTGLYYTSYLADNSGIVVSTRIQSTGILNGNCQNGGESDAFFDLHMKVMTDMARADPWPPQSMIQPLAPYTRLPYLLFELVGKDIGRSGLLSHDVQYRTGDSTTWKKIEDVIGWVPLEQSLAGPIYLRSRAVDLAGNEEPWPPGEDGERQTTLYRARFQGRYTDQRGAPLPAQPITIGPMALEQGLTGVDGNFLVHIGEHQYTVNSTMKLPATSDWQRDLYAVPSDNRLRNGNFEAATLTDWQVSGSPLPHLTDQMIYNGRQSIQLGTSCVGVCPPPHIPEFIQECLVNVVPGCVVPDPQSPQNYYLGNVWLIADPNNNLHFLGHTTAGQLIYQHGQPHAVWDPPVVLDGNMLINHLSTAVQDNGDLHLAWEGEAKLLYYRKRTNAGVWQPIQALGSGIKPQLAVSNSGVPHVLYLGDHPRASNQQSLHYRFLQTNGSWSTPTDVATYSYSANSLQTIAHDIAVTADGRVHLVWGKPEGESWAQVFRLVHKSRDQQGRWSSETGLALSQANVAELRLLAVAEQLHWLWQQDGTGFYANYAASAWSEPEQIGLYDDVTVDAAGTLHLLSDLTFETGRYRTKAPNQPWSDLYPLTRPSASALFPALNQGIGKTVHMIWPMSGNFVYYSQPPLTTTLTSQLQQVVTVPSTMHRPTLSFMYALAGEFAEASQLDVLVSNGISTTQVFSAAQRTAWTLGWADLTPWQRETVTVTVNLRQASGDLPVRAYLDDFALSAWQTALPQRFAPQQVEAGIAATLIISGENFIATPTVKVGNTALANIQLLDAQTVHAPLPTTLPPGNHVIWVTNPGSAIPMYAGLLQVGKPVYLPLIAR